MWMIRYVEFRYVEDSLCNVHYVDVRYIEIRYTEILKYSQFGVVLTRVSMFEVKFSPTHPLIRYFI